jgi:hypothetical protein
MSNDMDQSEDIGEQDEGCDEIRVLRRLADALRDAFCSEEQIDFDKNMDLAYAILEEYDAGPPVEECQLN